MTTSKANWSSLDLFTVNCVVTSAIALIAGHFITFWEIPWIHRNFAATGKFRGVAQNFMAHRKLWTISIIKRLTGTPVMKWRILLEQICATQMSMLITTSAFKLRRRD